MNIVALAIIRKGNLSQLLKLGVLRINLLASASCSLRIQITVLAILLIRFWRLRIRFENASFYFLSNLVNIQDIKNLFFSYFVGLWFFLIKICCKIEFGSGSTTHVSSSCTFGLTLVSSGRPVVVDRAKGGKRESSRGAQEDALHKAGPAGDSQPFRQVLNLLFPQYGWESIDDQVHGNQVLDEYYSGC